MAFTEKQIQYTCDSSTRLQVGYPLTCASDSEVSMCEAINRHVHIASQAVMRGGSIDSDLIY